MNWLFSKLGSQAGGEGAGMMDVLYCILNDSPEALNMMKEEHIKVQMKESIAKLTWLNLTNSTFSHALTMLGAPKRTLTY